MQVKNIKMNGSGLKKSKRSAVSAAVATMIVVVAASYIAPGYVYSTTLEFLKTIKTLRFLTGQTATR